MMITLLTNENKTVQDSKSNQTYSTKNNFNYVREQMVNPQVSTSTRDEVSDGNNSNVTKAKCSFIRQSMISF